MTERNIYYYKVAGFTFAVSLPEGADLGRGLESLSGFALEAQVQDGWNQEGGLLFKMTVQANGQCEATEPQPTGNYEAAGRTLVEEINNDMGQLTLYKTQGGPEPEDGTMTGTDSGWQVEIRSPRGRATHLMTSDRAFTQLRAWLDLTDPMAGAVLNSMLRTAFSQAVLLHGAVSVHASAVVTGGRAYLFTGPSGTGKSTHSRLWMANVPGTMLLNDDNPTVRIEGGRVMAYGTPWSGKTPCYKNEGWPMAALVRLSQGPVNRFEARTGAEAFATLLPGSSAIRSDRMLFDGLCDTLARMAGMVKVGTLECTPDGRAVAECRRGLGEAEA